MKKGDLVQLKPGILSRSWADRHGWLWIVEELTEVEQVVGVRSVATGARYGMAVGWLEEVPTDEEDN